MKKSISALLLTLMVITLMGPLPAQATEEPSLYAVPTGNETGACDSWANACTLAYALSIAEPGNQVWVAEGTHIPGSDREDTFALENGVAVYGGFQFDETDSENRDWEAYPTILSGDINNSGTLAGNSYHVVTASGTDQTAILDGFTITGGNANHGSTLQHQTGGGIYNSNGSPTLRNLIVQDNFAFLNGGGLYNIDNSSPTLTDVRFENNQSGFSGGAIFNIGNSNPVINRAYFIGNTTNAHFGGGIYYEDSNGASIITNTVFYNNSALDGGGAVYTIVSSNIQITNVTFYANQSRNAGSGAINGGAIANQNSTVNVKNSILWGNLSGTAIDPEISIIDSGTVNVSYSIVQGGRSGTGNRNTDPRFINTEDANLNLNLKSSSPAIDSGTNIDCPSEDIVGTARPQEIKASIPTCDMGAYELDPNSILVVTVRSTPVEDGWVLARNSANKQGGKVNRGAATLRIGDDKYNRQYRAFLSFDTSSIPENAIIEDVILKFKYEGKQGPRAFGGPSANLLVDIRSGAFSNNPTLQRSDFRSAAHKLKILIFKASDRDSEKWYIKSLAPGDFELINREANGVTQFRLRFDKATNNNSVANFLRIYSGDADWDNQPELIIVYSFPEE